MSTKRNSTISAKPAVDPALHWIGGAAAEAPASVPLEIVDKQANQQDNMQTSKQVGKQTAFVEAEPTSMFSARIPSALIRKLRIRAATEGRPIQEIVAELLRDYLDEE